MPLKIVVVGAGVAGLSAALFLRSTSHEVTILERGPLDFAGIDYGLSLFSNSLLLLQRVGIEIPNMEAVKMTHFWIRDGHSGDELATIPVGGPEFGPAGAANLRRGKLNKEMLRLVTSPDALPGRPATVIRNTRVTHVDCAAGKAWTADGTMYQADLIIGADGIGSSIRSAVMQQPSPPTTHDLLAFVTTVPIAAVRAIPELAYLHDTAVAGGCAFFSCEGGADFSEWKEKKRMIFYQVTSHEIMVVAYAPEEELAEQFGKSGGEGETVGPTASAGAFTGSASIVRDVPVERVQRAFGDYSRALTGMFGHAPIDAWRIRDIETLETWFRDRTLLVGDAAHALVPHSGMGCNMAIEDGEALAFFLKDVPGRDESDDAAVKMQEALDKFVRARRVRVDMVGRIARQTANIPSEDDLQKGRISIVDLLGLYSYEGIESVQKPVETVKAVEVAA